jgi:hypothetical protein
MITAGTAALLALSAGATATGQIVAGGKSAGAAKEAARLQTDAATEAARIQAQSDREALEFQKQEAARAQQIAEANRRANYEQWAADRRRLGTLGHVLGLPGPEIPGYVPIEPPRGTLGAAMPSATPTGATAPVTPGGTLTQAQQAFDTLFPDPTLTPDMLRAKEAELQAAGFILRPNAAGVVGKVQYGPGGPIIDVIQGAASGLNKKQWLLPQPAAGPRTMAQPGTLGALLQPLPYAQAPLTPALEAPQLRYPMGTLGRYL